MAGFVDLNELFEGRHSDRYVREHAIPWGLFRAR
jgi:hypothetical protein